MTRKYSAIAIFAGMLVALPIAVSAQTLCGIKSIKHDASKGQFTVKFDGEKSRKATLDKHARKLVFDRKDHIVEDEKKVMTQLEFDEDDKAYVSGGQGESCVIAPGKQDETSGVYIHWNLNLLTQPPQAATEFVEVK